MTASWGGLMTALREDPELAAVVVTGTGPRLQRRRGPVLDPR